MIKIINPDKWTQNKKAWWNIYGTYEGARSLVAKINTKGLAYIVAQKFTEIYQVVEIE